MRRYIPLKDRRADLPETETRTVAASSIRSGIGKRNLAKLEGIAHTTLCQVFNRFPLRLFPQLDARSGHFAIFELPPAPAETGCLPALYALLRQNYLSATKGYKRMAICARPDCQRAFEVERFGKRYCSDECSQLQRQKDYYFRQGRELRRRRRLAAKRKVASGKRSRAR